MDMTLKEFASMGGRAVLKKYGKEHFKKLAQLSSEKRKKFSTPPHLQGDKPLDKIE